MSLCRVLRKAEIPFEDHPHDYEERGGTARSASEIGVDEHQMKLLYNRRNLLQPHRDPIMRFKNIATAALLAFAAAGAPFAVQALDLTFLDQAPIRFFNDEDTKLMSDTTDKALDEAKDGEEVRWSNDQTGSSGTITPVRSFTRQGKDCRRLRVVNLASKATRGSATSNVDFCKVEGTWKILTIAP